MPNSLDNAYLSLLRKLETRKHKVYVVNGSPASGKTTFVHNHKKHGDIVFDFDRICAALGGTDELYEDHKPYLDIALAVRETVYDMISRRQGSWNNAYVITAQKDKNKVDKLVRYLGAELVYIDSTKERCIKNAFDDPRRQSRIDEQIKLINEYFGSSNEKE